MYGVIHTKLNAHEYNMGVAKLKITEEVLADLLYFPEEATILEVRGDHYSGMVDILLSDPSLPEGVLSDALLTVEIIADESAYDSRGIIRKKGKMTFNT